MSEYRKRNARHESSVKVPESGSLLRLSAVLDYLSISRTCFLEGVRSGRFPSSNSPQDRLRQAKAIMQRVRSSGPV
jgi:hypothetical protein